MRCRILHRAKGRLRVHGDRSRLTFAEADILENYLRQVPGVRDVAVYDRTGDAVIHFRGSGEGVLRALSLFSFETHADYLPEHSTRKLNRDYEDRLFFKLAGFVVKKFLSLPVRRVMISFKAVRYAYRGLRLLARRRLEVPVLDAVAIGVSAGRGDYGTAGSVMFLLEVGEILEEWTYKKSVADLAGTLSLGVSRVFRIREDGQEELTDIRRVQTGDRIVVRMGGMVPLDGRVVDGEAMINQATITGEPLPVRKAAGSYAYAGTVVDEGECTIEVDKVSGEGKYDRIVRMIEESESLKSNLEANASHLADRLVPFSFGGTLATFLLTRNVTKAVSVLMVDFSCALKLSMPLAVLAAMREAGRDGVTVKGGRFLEAAAEADTMVFDKTGTLTFARPKVAKIFTFGDADETEALRLAACLEEHYPHSMATAVVEEAARRGILHEERHTRVEYVVAHGISSSIDGKKAVIGSRHFVLEDEACRVPADAAGTLENLPGEYSHLYLAVGGVLLAVLCIEDPLRPEAGHVVEELHKLGLRRVVMMTGDNERTASAVAFAVGVDDYRSEVLPEDKASFVRSEHEAGRKVIMVGDGVNDSPALAEADVGIAIAAGAAIAREVSDVTVSGEDLSSLLVLRKLSAALMDRIHANYRFIIGFNFGLILLGVLGILPPAVSALLHNTSTIAISLHSMTPLLERKE